MTVVIKKRKTERPEFWDLTINDQVVGNAFASYRTESQRDWEGSIEVPLVGGEMLSLSHDCVEDKPEEIKGQWNSASSVIKFFTWELEGKDIDIAPPEPKVRKPRKAKAVEVAEVVEGEAVVVEGEVVEVVEVVEAVLTDAEVTALADGEAVVVESGAADEKEAAVEVEVAEAAVEVAVVEEAVVEEAEKEVETVA